MQRDKTFELVSIVIPTHNREKLLEQALNSVRSQSWPNIEIIVVDDASNDGTALYLEREAAVDNRIKIVCNEAPQGGAVARNLGIKLASGVFVAFLDDDDLWEPDKLIKQIDMLRSNPSASAVSCSHIVKTNNGKHSLQKLHAPNDLQQVLKANKFGGASMCVTTKKALNTIGGFDQSLRSGQDWDLWIRLCVEGPILMSPEPLVIYQLHEGIRITTNKKSAYWGRRRIYFKYKNILNCDNKRHHLRDLLYLRMISQTSSKISFLRSFCRIFRQHGFLYTMRCVYRLIKLV